MHKGLPAAMCRSRLRGTIDPTYPPRQREPSSFSPIDRWLLLDLVVHVQGASYRFPAVQVGTRGLQCPLPSELANHVYGGSKGCEVVPPAGVTFLLQRPSVDGGCVASQPPAVDFGSLL